MPENHKPDGTMTKEALNEADQALIKEDIEKLAGSMKSDDQALKDELEADIAGMKPGDIEIGTENAPGAAAPAPSMPPFVPAYKTIVNPTGAPDAWVAIMVGTDGSIKIGVSSHGEDDAVDDALLP